MTDKLKIILGAPGEAEMPLLADLGARDDCTIVAVIDPTGQALGASIAEIMGIPVVPSIDALGARHLPPEDVPLFVLPLGLGSLVASLSAGASARGLPTIRSDELRAKLFRRRQQIMRHAPSPAPAFGLEEIERESAELQAALTGLEDALAGDTILRQLLDLCTRATGASGGSLMLFDESSRELYIAYAVGLSEGTLHSTRMRMGEGIAGRVAHTRQVELLSGAQNTPGRRQDRPDIATAICAPLLSHGRLLGVLNLSTQAGEPPLDERARDVLAGLAPRLGCILNGVQQLQQQRTSRLFDLTEQHLRRLADDHRELPDMLVAWCEALAVTADAERLSLVIPCEDGGLLVCENAPGAEGSHWYEPLHNPAWLEVLGNGLPLVARQTEYADAEVGPATVFYLPVAREPVLAGVAVHFAHSRQAHGFHAMAGEMLFLLERLLTDQLGQRRQKSRAERLAALSAALTQMAVHEGTPGQLGEMICSAAGRLTGARHVAAVADVDDGMARLAGGNVPEAAEWHSELPRLLNEAAGEGWRITTLETGRKTLSVLTAVGRTGEPAPGMVLLGKQRLHELDGQVFTPLDAEILVPLAAGLCQAVQDPDSLVDEMRPLAAEIEVARAGGICGRVEKGRARLLEDLDRELDRCVRYHNVCGLLLFRPHLPTADSIDLLQAAVKNLSSYLRNSDRCYPLDDGCLAVLVPEDVHQLDRVQDRVLTALREQTDDPDLTIDAARVAYPAIKGTAEELLARAQQRLGG